MVSSRKKSQCAIGSMLDLLNEPATSRSHNQENNSNCSNSLNSSSSTDSESLHTSESFEDDSDDEQNANNNDPLEEDTIGRGPTRQGFRWGTGEKMILELNDDNQVVGSMAAEFATQLGVLAKEGNKLPLIYTDWRALPKPMKDDVWAEVKENTNLTDVYKKTCLRRVGKLWKDFKMRTKEKYFRPHRRDKTYLLANRPGRIEEDQWPALVNYWLSKRARKISNRNKRNRKDLQMPHRQGRTDTYNLQNQATLKALKQQLPPELQDDIEANNKILKTSLEKMLQDAYAAVQDSSNSQHQIALNEPLHGLGNSSNNGQTNQSTKVSKEINQSKDDNPPLICSDATSTKEIQKVT
ncbi:OLC1v1007800C1 [Oldenlandia corymbosa var. corymbosa]|uniref:OLC1v1007800C1 n=1 Tax=Oldenlandia corymbosa var. corymbosa TaxID=529605 RepID=A0AAV1DK25_OLDCO|nr:OLC1v1007800C1 [Oldenlandia corymbosa var. corymbosa]